MQLRDERMCSAPEGLPFLNGRSRSEETVEGTMCAWLVADGGIQAVGTGDRGTRSNRRSAMAHVMLSAVTVLLVAAGAQAQDRDAKVADLDRKLSNARELAQELQRTIDLLAAELRALREPVTAEPPATPDIVGITTDSVGSGSAGFHEQIVRTDLARDERGDELGGAPELFIQSRYQALPIKDATISEAPTNFELTRMETRWSGRLSPKVGLGFELQYHPAPDGAAFEIINDAFAEYYLSDRVTVRAGQFVKPFGFDIQHSSSDRESPERGIFAGYFFPGQRDRGAMLQAGLGHGVQVYLGAFNGNRFFTDADRRLNYNLRVRKVFAGVPLAAGVSAQLGRQLLADGVSGKGRENLVGVDVQWAWRRLGVRAEWVAGDRPSTLLGLEPDFAPAYRSGARSSGGALFSMVRVTDANHVYGRYDQFNGDPVFGYNVRAFNLGYLRQIGSNSRVGVDYQFKTRLTANDDSLNSRLQVTWNVER